MVIVTLHASVVAVSASAVCVLVGGRFKKEVVLDGQSYLLLIRDEGGLPEMQVLLQCCVIIVSFP